MPSALKTLKYVFNVDASIGSENVNVRKVDGSKSSTATEPLVRSGGVWSSVSVPRLSGSSGGGFVRAKLWPRGQPEPAAWTIEIRRDRLHQHGAPAVYAFSPQSMKRVFIDNLSITANE